LNQACRQARQWQIDCGTEADLAITSIFPCRQFQDISLLSTVTDALARSGLAARSLILEITEGTMLANSETT